MRRGRSVTCSDILRKLASGKAALLIVLIVLGLQGCLLRSEDRSGGWDDFPEEEVAVDLAEMSRKIRYVALVGDDRPPAVKAGQPVRKQSRQPTDCVDGILVGEGQFTADLRGEVVYRDTTWFYNALALPACPSDTGGIEGWSVLSGYERDSLSEFWKRVRTDKLMSGGYQALGSGRIHYFSDFEVTLDTMQAMIESDGRMTGFKLILGLKQGRYRTSLSPGPGIDLNNEEGWGPDQVILVGPIVRKNRTVGYFEILGNDRVVIRDKEGGVVLVP